MLYVTKYNMTPPLFTLIKYLYKIFCSLDHTFSNYDERKTNEMHFQRKPYI
jgi:hypothetical protein